MILKQQWIRRQRWDLNALKWHAGRPEGAERRYAGVSHIDAGRVAADEAYRNHILDYTKEKNIQISALAYYPNTMDPDLEKRRENIDHLKKVIKAYTRSRVLLA